MNFHRRLLDTFKAQKLEVWDALVPKLWSSKLNPAEKEAAPLFVRQTPKGPSATSEKKAVPLFKDEVANIMCQCGQAIPLPFAKLFHTPGLPSETVMARADLFWGRTGSPTHPYASGVGTELVSAAGLVSTRPFLGKQSHLIC